MLKGDDIDHITTINSRYANNCVRVFDKEGKEYRMHVGDLLNLFRGKEFKVMQKRVWGYLISEEK